VSSQVVHSLWGGSGGNDVEFWVRAAQNIRSVPLHLHKFVGFRTFRSAVTTVRVTVVSTLQFVRGGCRNSGHPEGVEARSFMSLIDSVGDHDTGFRCYLAGRRCFSRT